MNWDPNARPAWLQVDDHATGTRTTFRDGRVDREALAQASKRQMRKARALKWAARAAGTHGFFVRLSYGQVVETGQLPPEQIGVVQDAGGRS